MWQFDRSWAYRASTQKTLGTGPPSCEEKTEKIHLLFSENGPNSDSKASFRSFPGTVLILYIY